MGLEGRLISHARRRGDAWSPLATEQKKNIKTPTFRFNCLFYLRRLKRKDNILSPSVCLYSEVSTRTNELLRNPVKVFRGGVSGKGGRRG